MNKRESLLYVLATLAAVVATWSLHEFSHWTMGTLLGNTMAMTLNTCYPLAGKYQEPWHGTLISAAGPVITILQAFVFYYLLRKNQSKFLFPFLLTCFYMRTLAGFMNLINLNDEGRISNALGLTPAFLPVVVTGILFYLVYTTIKAQHYKIRLVTSTVLLIMLFSSILILSDQAFNLVLIN